MALLLGIDTGGTYTDAVLLDEDEGIIASAKSLTTRQDFSIGIGRSVARVIEDAKALASDIGLVSLSTTLATNALVEGQGGRICLVLIGFDEDALNRNGLRDALKGDPVIFLAGGHNGQGEALCPLAEEKLTAELDALGERVSAFAIAGLFAIRNPEHELRARDIILSHSANSVTCSHELSSKLDGPRRALTSVLNARLINMIHHLITSSEALFGEMGIEAPLMVVQGDGALIAAEVAKIKPIETILSGPAASLVGAAYLSREQSAIISDIGGTTTDVAILEDGSPRLDPDGATVGGWRTMVEAVAIYTVGLGGDSEVAAVKSGMELALSLGPRRLVPVSLLATDYPDLVHSVLDSQLGRDRQQENYGCFALAVGRDSTHLETFGEMEQQLLDALKDGPQPLEKLLLRRRQHNALERLVSSGLVMISGLTPSDAAHILGLHDAWDREAAEKAATLFTRNRDVKGHAIAASARDLAGLIMEAVVMRSSETLLEAALAKDPLPGRDAGTLLKAAAVSGHHPYVNMEVALRLPVIGLGASAHLYYPEVAKKLGTIAVIPDFAGVANAVGAVVGQVRLTVSASISPTENDGFRLFHMGEPLDFQTLDAAVSEAEKLLTAEARAQAIEAGAGDVRTRFKRQDNIAHIAGLEVFVESTVEVVAFGRPRVAR
ncbi:hydantoinase/oxoprolinase family protein [uncultured Sneathiella sp.]|uniref:hydantoinase/oxoprolinase family protein n=1 Tax=uncultured Sneathiella sp. TaxID=879315 RepID=UPI0030EEC2F9|tara:strand:+ start:18535 stop:20529 length:1995 start_codon:yes stop_codon:yes gene_type:complete